ncbi:MAG: Rossmann-like and DUF2520 domain-containing protein [Bacteroidia bacterium]
MAKKENIVLVGAGNLATHLGIALKRSGHQIIQVYSPGGKTARLLAKTLGAESTGEIKKIRKDATLYIIAVKDDAIETVSGELHLKDQVVVHTSGSVKMNVLKKSSKNIGVLYPLQTFSKSQKTDFKNVPLCLESNSEAAAGLLAKVAGSISGHIQAVSSEQRRALHLSAVFACNFSNHMYRIAELILSSEKMSFDLLKPLIMETAEKVQNASPSVMQTGPAARGDLKTIKAHLKLLKHDKKLRSIYQLLSASIIETDKKL